MKQAELNVIFEQSAMLINELPPAFDEPWWGSANVTAREYLVIEQVDSFRLTAAQSGLKFSPAKFAAVALPNADASRRALLLREDHEFVNGIWTRAGSDPYAEGKVAAGIGTRASDMAEGCRLAAGIVNQEAA